MKIRWLILLGLGVSSFADTVDTDPPPPSAAPVKLEEKAPIRLEGKAAYFIPSGKLFQEIYSGGGIYGLEISSVGVGFGYRF